MAYAGLEPVTPCLQVGGAPGGRGFNPCQGPQHSFVEIDQIDHEKFGLNNILFI